MRLIIIIIVLLFSSPVHSMDTYKRIHESIISNSITIIGERHRRPEAVRFFRSLVTSYLQQNKCLTIGLEIASSQQPLLDKMAEGKATVFDIEIFPIIDHPPLRALISDLAEMQKHNDCLKLFAIDAGLELETNRDVWMAVKLAEQVNETPLLVLLGNLHTLKKVDWDLTMTKGTSYVAEILALQGHDVKTYPQIWTDYACSTWSRFIPADTPEAVKLINSKLIAKLNAFESKAAIGVIDGVILWECD